MSKFTYAGRGIFVLLLIIFFSCEWDKGQQSLDFTDLTSLFALGEEPPPYSGSIKFIDPTTVATGGNGFTSLVIGPDEKLYALSSDGFIKRWAIDHQTGLLSQEEVISTLRDTEGGNRLSIGMAFDPQATATNPILWVSHTSYGFHKEPNFQGKITKLSGQHLQHIQDYVIHLPRSIRDHGTNGIQFGPDSALYILQGSNSAMGSYDEAWKRHEVLLSGALLRLDVSLIEEQQWTLPIDSKTEQGGTYNPYAPGAPLTLYATGLRNAYDLVFHSNGQLYVPGNGSTGGLANAPGSDPGSPSYRPPQYKTYSGPAVPYLSELPSQSDYLFTIEKGGYYGHPNPRRAEYVLNGGNPANPSWPEAVVTQYPVGTNPDANYKGYSENLGHNQSPNGVIEYKSSAFNGALAGKLINVWFGPSTLVVMEIGNGSSKHISKVIEGIPGFQGFNKPLDVVEDTRNGNLYVSEYQAATQGGAGKITLLKPEVPPATTTVAQHEQ